MINLTEEEFTLIEGYYYSSPFKQDDKDSIFTVGALLNAEGSVTLQNSTDEEIWVDIVDSGFTCSPFGLQSFCNGHHLLFYRIKTNILPIYAQILI